MVREPAAAGQFYEGDYEKLFLQIKECFHHKLGPGALPISKRTGFVRAIISPHAGYMFSGPCAAWVYKEIAESEPAELYILIGPNHYGLGSSISFEDWKTPLGILKTDKDFSRELSDSTGMQINESFHEHEHSIEVQLPFLLFANKNLKKNIRICCITLSSDIDLDKLASDLNSFLAGRSRRITFIISSDFTHYGHNYGYLPFTSEIGNKLKELDGGAIDLILGKNPTGLISYVKKTGATICGYKPIYLLLKILGSEKGKLLCYYKSSDIFGDSRNSVSYASIIFK